MSRQEERYWAAVRALRETMDKLDSDKSQLSPRVALYRAGKSWLVWAWHDDPYPGALAIIPAPDGDEAETGITAEVLREIPMPEILGDTQAIRPLVALKRTRQAISRFRDYVASGGQGDLYYAMLGDVYESITARGDTNPAATLARLAGLDVEMMRTHISHACSRGLLTDPREPAGGRLTDQALALLSTAEG